MKIFLKLESQITRQTLINLKNWRLARYLSKRAEERKIIRNNRIRNCDETYIYTEIAWYFSSMDFLNDPSIPCASVSRKLADVFEQQIEEESEENLIFTNARGRRN